MEPKPRDDKTTGDVVFNPELIAIRQDNLRYFANKRELIELLESKGFTVLPEYKDSDDRYFTDELLAKFDSLAQSGEYGNEEEVIEALDMEPLDYSIVIMAGALVETKQLWQSGDEIAAFDTRNLILGQLLKSLNVSNDTIQGLVSLVNEYLSDTVGEIQMTPEVVEDLIKRAEINDDNLDAYCVTVGEIAIYILNEHGEHQHLESLVTVLMAIAEREFETDRLGDTTNPGIVIDEDPEKEAKLASVLAQAKEYASQMGISSDELSYMISLATAGLAENGYEPIVQ